MRGVKREGARAGGEYVGAAILASRRETFRKEMASLLSARA
jgi:hypothetical protein